jgi:hypothetical protein
MYPKMSPTVEQEKDFYQSVSRNLYRLLSRCDSLYQSLSRLLEPLPTVEQA